MTSSSDSDHKPLHRDYVLIVDDSKTAQIRLKRMLEKYDLDIDTALSAEEALGYLSYRRPAIIFLDHNMKGMDGFDALKTIKANASTATIPVIMYTSEKGDVYTSQARALGALDILSKSTLAPANLEHLLKKFKLVPSQNPVAAEDRAPVQRSSDSVKSELDSIRAQVGRLFEIHVADVSRQISKSTQFIVKRLASAIDNSGAGTKEIVVGDIPLSVLNDEVSAERRKIALVSNSLLVILFIGMGFLGSQLFFMQQKLEIAAKNYEIATFASELSSAQVRDAAEEMLNSRPNSVTVPTLAATVPFLDAINLAAKTDFTYAWNEEPLNEKQLANLQVLIYMLANSSYDGPVELNIHSGNFCLTVGESGDPELADGNTPMAECTLRQTLNESYSADNYLNLAYLNFERAINSTPEGGVNISVNSSGLRNPREPYPQNTDQLTAAQWNRIAQKNNYIEINFPTTDSRLTVE